MVSRELPLLIDTPREWAPQALSSIHQLLNDHAHLERKAASNALELFTRWPDANPSAYWLRVTANVARDEVQHLARVSGILNKRGGEISRTHRNEYASALHKKIRLGRAKEELVDRLFVAALIEARSCERFLCLADSDECDAELKRLYRALWSSEHGHYKVFLELAKSVVKEGDLKKRWKEWLRIESEVIQEQKPGCRIHSWV